VKARTAALLVTALVACSEPAPELPTFDHRAALVEGLDAAEAAVAALPSPSGPTEEPDPEHVQGLVHMLANSSGRTRELPLEEIGTLGDPAAPQLAVIAANGEHDAGERLAACELLAKLGTPRAVEHLLQLCEKSPEGWLRAQAAWRLGEVDADWVVPRLVYRLKYELDAEAAIWLASTLGRHGNHSGLEALWNLRSNGEDEAIRGSAEQRLGELAAGVGAASPEEHWELWTGTDPERRLWRTDPSPRLVLAVWREIEQLSGEHFQLRGVDDARFILSRMGSWVTAPLADALHDEDVYVRVHVAQCLERMGPRANQAGPTLVQALADPALAPAAAAALGTVAYPSAEPVLRRLLAEASTDHELRVACATSLGQTGLTASVPALEAIVGAEGPHDLRLASASALVTLGVGGRGAAFLVEALRPGAPDRHGAEAALQRWLESLEGDVAGEVLQEWRAQEPAPGSIPTVTEVQQRLELRLELLESRRGQLNGL